MRTTLALALALSACTGPTPTDDADTPQPGELRAGFGRARIPAPVGIGTAGFGPTGAPDSESPFSNIYPATQHILGHPELKVWALSRGDGFEAVFVRVDAVGIFAQLRAEIVAEASARVGHDLDDALLLGATHTHSGPGGVLNTGTDQPSFFDIIADQFFPEFYEQFVDAAADAVEQAYDDLRPARLGTTATLCPEGHGDRGCEAGVDYKNSEVPVVAIERDGQLDGLILAYAIHGTVLGLDDLHLSRDVSGAIEHAVEDAFDHPVHALMFNSWGADMSPANPDLETRPAAARHESVPRLARVGKVVADAVEGALPDLSWHDAPDIALETHRVAIDRDLIGYEGGEFPYPFGGVYCGGGSSGSCDAPFLVEDLDKACLPFNETFPAPDQVDVTVGRLADLAIVTWPGEPGTLLAERLMDELRTDHPDVEDFLFLGYTQDYLGYSILEEEWWYGGYEAGGGLWGPRQGDYLVEQIRGVYGRFVDAAGTSGEPAALAPFPYTVTSPYAVASAVEGNTVHADVASTYTAADAVVLEINGQDPWLGAPLATVRTADGAPVTRPGGLPLDSDGYDFDVQLTVDPPWDEPAAARRFVWRLRLAPRSPVAGGLDLTGGSYQIAVSVPQPDGSTVEVTSGTFTVTE